MKLIAHLLLFLACLAIRAVAQSPNIVVIFADDLGYGDLGSYGHPTIRTPHLDRMAAEGQRWTQFYVAASVCTPSRSALMTGRLPVRSGMASHQHRVLFPDSFGGLPAGEITIAEMLKERGYATAMVGKWHLGHLPQFLPTQHGFDSYFGIPYSNDMDRVEDSPPGREAFLAPKPEYWNVPLMRSAGVVERPAIQTTITKRYTEEAVRFIRDEREGPFFLYLAHNLPHVPLFRSEAFSGVSLRGLYGDVIEEIDWSVGQVLAALREQGLDSNTLVVFTSDNGPWLAYGEQGGSAGLLRNGKGTTWEGGMRVPGIFWWPGRIQPAVVTGIGSTLDLLPTFAAMAHVHPPPGRRLDGQDLSPALFEGKASPRQEMFYYRGETVYAVRSGPWKAHFITQLAYVPEADPVMHSPPELYHLERDPGEQRNVAADYPDVVERLIGLAAAHKKTIEPTPNQLVRRGPGALR
jgi:arylsulfatase A-like enzyme